MSFLRPLRELIRPRLVAFLVIAAAAGAVFLSLPASLPAQDKKAEEKALKNAHRGGC